MPIRLSIMRRQLSSLLFCLVLILAGCKDDDYTVPSYRVDLMCALTDADSVVSHLLLDDGSRYSVGTQRIKASEPNAMIRCLGTFSIDEDSVTVKVYDLLRVSCYAPLPVDSFKVQPHDPVNVVSVWKSGGFVNLCLAPLVDEQGGMKYDFCIDSITHHHDNIAIHASLLFQRRSGSIEAYTHKFYHSIPLESPYYPNDYDSIYIHINTYNGTTAYPFSR